METGCSIGLSVVHDGQFWIGLFERQDGCAYAVARVVFGAEPSDTELLDLVCRRFASVRFTRLVADDKAGTAPLAPLPTNPKRRKREVARALRDDASKPGTKAQRALAAERDLQGQEAKARRHALRAENDEAAFARRQAKRKAKHRGH